MQFVSYASNHSTLLIIHVWINPFHFSEIQNCTYSSMQTHGFHLFPGLNKVMAVQRERHDERGGGDNVQVYDLFQKLSTVSTS
jgi:hypothetical protein